MLCVSAVRSSSQPCCFHAVNLTFQNTSFKYTQVPSRAGEGDIIQGLSVSFSPTVFLHLPLTFSLLPLPWCIPFPCLLAHELSVLPAIPIIVTCSGAENRGRKSEMCGAWLFSAQHRLFSVMYVLPLLMAG